MYTLHIILCVHVHPSREPWYLVMKRLIVLVSQRTVVKRLIVSTWQWRVLIDGSLYVPTPQRNVRESIKKCRNCSIKSLLHGLEAVRWVHQASESNVVAPHLVVKVRWVPLMWEAWGWVGLFLSHMLVMVVLVSGHCLKHRLNTSLAMLKKLLLLHRWLLS